MPYLDYIEDNVLIQHVSNVVKAALDAKERALNKFHANVIDPFAAMFEMAGFQLGRDEWKESELARKAQKSLQNHVGDFHQKILGCVDGWNDMGIGGNIDLRSEGNRIIAEVKNKYNTVSGGKLVNVYEDLESLVNPRSSIYCNYTAYFVTIIPRANDRHFDKPFTPPDRSSGHRCPENQNIRTIDGCSFYHKVTGRKDALCELYEVLPIVIERVLDQNTSLAGFRFSTQDKDALTSYFKKAFIVE